MSVRSSTLFGVLLLAACQPDSAVTLRRVSDPTTNAALEVTLELDLEQSPPRLVFVYGNSGDAPITAAVVGAVDVVFSSANATHHIPRPECGPAEKCPLDIVLPSEPRHYVQVPVGDRLPASRMSVERLPFYDLCDYTYCDYTMHLEVGRISGSQYRLSSGTHRLRTRYDLARRDLPEALKDDSTVLVGEIMGPEYELVLP